MDKEETIEETIEALRDDVKEMSVYCAAHPEFIESVNGMDVTYDRETELLVCRREGYPDIIVQIEINKDAAEAFGEETYVRLLAVRMAYEYDTALAEKQNLDARINAPYPRSLQ